MLLNEKMNLFFEFSTRGIYTLLLFVFKEVNLNIGKLGRKRFPEGIYTYTGSAFGKGASNLKHRLTRHLRKKKQKFWHIDYLLSNPNVSIEMFIVAETNKNLQCNVNQQLKKIAGARVQVKGFGASDCRKNCGSHLLYFPDVDQPDFLVQSVVEYLRTSANIFSVSVIN